MQPEHRKNDQRFVAWPTRWEVVVADADDILEVSPQVATVFFKTKM